MKLALCVALKCKGDMKIISFINETDVIKKRLEHLGLWPQKPSREPPKNNSAHKINDFVYEPFDDGWSDYEEPCITVN